MRDRNAYYHSIETEPSEGNKMHTTFQVTLKQLREHKACVEGYNKVVCMLSGGAFNADRKSYIRFKHDEPISLVDIANNNGVCDALWATRCLDESHDRDLRLYAVWCARQVQHLMTDQRSLYALDVAERYANGLATDEELKTARTAAEAARTAAEAARTAALAARTAALAARTAALAAWDAAEAAARESQQQMFIAMCQGKAPW